MQKASFSEIESLGLQADFIEIIPLSKVNGNKLQFEFLSSVVEQGSGAVCVHACIRMWRPGTGPEHPPR